MDKLLYVWITKSASQSTFHYYRNNTKINFLNRDNNLIITPIDNTKLFIPERKKKLLDYRKYAYQVEEVKKFTIVRNPYDRFISSWKYLINYKKISSDMEVLKFFELVNNIIHIPSEELSEDDLIIKRHVLPQSEFIFDGNVDVCNFIGRLENIDHHLSILDKCLNLNSKKVQNLNSTRPANDFYKKYYDFELEKKVAEVYSKDLEYFKYDMNNLNFDIIKNEL